MANLQEKMGKARMRARKGFPYFGNILYRMPWFQEEGHGTMSVDARARLTVDPEWVERAPIPVLAAAFIHEVGHIVLRHGKRFESHMNHRGFPEMDWNKYHTLWNIAGDMEWNETIREFCKSEHNVQPIPSKGVVPLLEMYQELVFCDAYKLPPNQSAEFYFDKLLEQQEKEKESKGKGKGKGDGEEEQPCGAGAGNELGQPKSNVGGGACGGCATRSKEPGNAEEGGGATSQEMGDMVREAMGGVRDAAAQGRGFVPMTLQRIADEELAPPQVPWQSLVKRFIGMGEARSSGKVDFTYKRPSRRWNPFGILLPSMFAPKPTVAIVADTSGSMGKTDLSKVLQETRGCIRYAEKVWFIPTDARAHECIKINNINQARDVLIGGGGTDMGAGLEVAGEKRPTMTVVVTDGITDWPNHMPEGNKNVLIIRVNEGGRTWKTPDWATVIDISVE